MAELWSKELFGEIAAGMEGKPPNCEGREFKHIKEKTTTSQQQEEEEEKEARKKEGKKERRDVVAVVVAWFAWILGCLRRRKR